MFGRWKGVGGISGTLTDRYRWVLPEQHVGQVLVLGVQPPQQEGFTSARPLAGWLQAGLVSSSGSGQLLVPVLDP